MSSQTGGPEAYSHSPILSWKCCSFVCLLACLFLQGYFLMQPARTKGVCLQCGSGSADAFSQCLQEGSAETGTWYFSNLGATGTSVGYCVSEAAFARVGFPWVSIQAACGQKGGICMISVWHQVLVSPKTKRVFQLKQVKGSLFLSRDKGTYLHFSTRPGATSWYVRRVYCWVQFRCLRAKSTEEENSVRFYIKFT